MKYCDRVLRHEIKFPAAYAQCEELRERLAAVMERDNHSLGERYRVTSLYFDDVYRSAYNDKLIGADRRKKYRLRCYNLNQDTLHMECKYKYGEMVSKQSYPLTTEQYYSILQGDCTFMWDKQYSDTVLEEFSFSNAAALLKPSVIVDYNREAFVKREGNVRITIDSGFKLGAFSSDMLSEEIRYLPVCEYPAVVEVKYDEYAPGYIIELLQGLKLTQESVSKFILCKTKQLAMCLQ